MRSKITDMLEALKAGDMTVEEVADAFRNGAIKDGDPRPGSLEESLANEGSGFEEGTFDEVSRALHLGIIDIDQYGILVEAVDGGGEDDEDPAEETPATEVDAAPATPANPATPMPPKPPTAP